MSTVKISFDFDEFLKLRKVHQTLHVNWVLKVLNDHRGTKRGLGHSIIFFSNRNLLVEGRKFHADQENDTYDKFEKYLYYDLSIKCDAELLPIKKTNKETVLIVDEYGIRKFKDLQLVRLSYKQVEKKYGLIANAFKDNQDAVFYIPKKYKDLPVKSVIRIRNGIKILCNKDDENCELHDWGIGYVNCNINSDEKIFLKFSTYNPNSTDKFYNQLCFYRYIEYSPYIDFDNQNFHIDKQFTTKLVDARNCIQGNEQVTYEVCLNYKRYVQKEWGITTVFQIDLKLSHSAEVNAIINERLRVDEEKRRLEEEKRKAEEERRRKEEEARLEKFRYNKRNSHRRDYYISFDEANHKYTVDGNTLQSVTNIVENCFPKFDAQLHAKATAAKMGMTEEEVIAMWERKGKESRELGTVMHQKIESYYQGKDSREDDAFRLFKVFADKVKLEPYRTEWAVYDTDYNIAGTIDFVDCQDGKYTIYDWKRSDKIIANGMPVKVSRYQEKGLYPLEHLENCAYYHYALQLSLYKFILEKNYDIKVSDLRLGIFHPSYDKPYVLKMPYLENEVKSLMELRSEVIL